MNDTPDRIRWILVAIPCAVLVGYAWFLVASYSEYLDWHLRYRRPPIGVAPEDVLGIGFFVPWLFISLLFLFALLSAMSAIERRVRLAVALLVPYGALSALDLFLYRTLEQQVLAL